MAAATAAAAAARAAAALAARPVTPRRDRLSARTPAIFSARSARRTSYSAASFSRSDQTASGIVDAAAAAGATAAPDPVGTGSAPLPATQPTRVNRPVDAREPRTARPSSPVYFVPSGLRRLV